MAGAVINVGTVIKDCVIVNTACSIDHDCVVSSFAHSSPGVRIGGGVSIGEKSWIGIGATIKNFLTVGSGVLVGAGATVVSNVEDGMTVTGTPAKEKQS
jgi:acetyltransferase-like isoleucine patch superfamily enzyme